MARATGCWLVLVGMLLGSLPLDGLAQERDRRRQFLQGLLDAFIDSQLDEKRPAAGPDQPTAPRASIRRDVASLSPELRPAGQLLADAADEMNALLRSLQDDIFRAPGIRPLLSLAMKVNADAAVLSRRLQSARDLTALREPLQQLDQDWHTLDYRLSQVTNLSAATKRQLQRVREYEQRLADLIGVTTQVDFEQVKDHAVSLHSSVRRLLEDIRFEISDARVATSWIQAGRATFERSRQFVQTVTPGASYQAMHDAYEAFEQDWLKYERQLRVLQNRYVQRQVQRVNETSRELHGLLYLDALPTRREDIQHQLTLLRRDIDALLGQVNLKMLAELPGERSVAVTAASDLDVVCNDLLGVVEAGDELDVIQELYIYLHDEWERLSAALSGITAAGARQAVRDVEHSVHELQVTLGVQFDFDRKSSTELAESIVHLAKHAQEDIRSVFGRPNRYPREFQASALQSAAQFHAAAQSLHEGLASGDKLRELKTQCEQMSTAWARLDKLIPRFRLGEGGHLGALSRNTTPSVIKMQTLLAL